MELSSVEQCQRCRSYADTDEVIECAGCELVVCLACQDTNSGECCAECKEDDVLDPYDLDYES